MYIGAPIWKNLNFHCLHIIKLTDCFTKHQVDQADARFYPSMLDNLLGLKIVAKGKWSPTFKSMMVDSFSNDQDLFDFIETKLT
jgi:hypothetical protein